MNNLIIVVLLFMVSATAYGHPCESPNSPAGSPVVGTSSANAYPGTEVPKRKRQDALGTSPAPVSSPKPQRYASYREMAEDIQIQRLFSPWIGPGAMYVNNARKYMKDLTNTRRNSYNGLLSRKYVDCKIRQTGKSMFVAFGQSDSKVISWWGREVASTHGGVWPSSSDVSPDQQAKYESYCELFHQLAPHFISLGLLEP